MTDTKRDVVVLQHDEKRLHVHLRGVFGDSGENEGVLSVSAILDSTENDPVRIIVGSPKASPLIEGYIPNLGGFSTDLDGAGQLVVELQGAIRAIRLSDSGAMERPEPGTDGPASHLTSDHCSAGGHAQVASNDLLVALISENRNALVPVKYWFGKVNTTDPVGAARAMSLVQRVLDYTQAIHGALDATSHDPEIHALVDTAFDARGKIFKHVGYVEDWCVFPFEDSRTMFWAVDVCERRWLKYSPKREALEFWLQNGEDNFGVYGDLLFKDSIYTQRFLPKWVYRGPELSMVVADDHCDQNKFLRLLLTKNEVLK